MTPVLTEASIRRLPPEIVDKLRSLIARIRRVLWWRGFWSSLAVLVVCLMGVMAVDAAFDLESMAVRCALSLLALGVVGAAVWRTLIRPMSRTFGLAQVARLVEIHHPEMHERISTAVELLGSQDSAELRGSDELLAEVVKSAVVDVATVSPESEYPSLPTRWPRRLAFGALALLAAILAIWPFQGGMLVARALLPFANIGSASAFDLRVITQDVQVGEGEPLTILVAAKGRAAKRVELRCERAESPEGAASALPTVERLVPQSGEHARPGETVFALTLPAVQESFRYAASAGRARSRTHFVEVLRKPDVTGLRVTYTFPPYTGLSPRTDAHSLGDITALVGTRVEVTATLSRPATKATVVFDQTENAGPDVELATEAGQPVAKWTAELTPGMNYRWTLHPMAGEDRFGKPASGRLRAVDDLPPAVVIDSPLERELSLRPNDTLPIVYSAADDHGFTAVDLVVALDGRGERLLTMPLPEADPGVPQTWRGTASLELSKLPLAGVSEVHATLRVSDSLPPNLNGPQTAHAESILIRLQWGAETFAHQTIRLQEEALRRDLERLKDDLWKQRRQAEEKAWQLREPDRLSGDRLRELQELTERAATSVSELEEIARKAAHSAFAERADTIGQTAREQVQHAAESLQEIPQSDRPEDRSASAERARDQFENAARQLDDVLNAFHRDREQGRELGELASLAREQQSLADQAAAAAPDARPEPSGSAETADSSPPSSPPSSDPAADQAHPAAPAPASPSDAVAAHPLADPSASTKQKAEAFDRWQEQQASVERRAQDVTQRFQDKVPIDRPSDLAALASKVQELARQADGLADQQQAVANKAGLAGQPPPAPRQPDASSTASQPAGPAHDPASVPSTASSATLPSPAPATAQSIAQASQQQADVASSAESLAQDVESLQHEARETLRQNGSAQAQSQRAFQALDAAAATARTASSALAQEAGQAKAPRALSQNESSQASSASRNGDDLRQETTAGTRPAEATPETPTAGPQAAEVPPSSSSPPPTATPGQQAVAQTASSLDTAASALHKMAQALSAQSEGVATAAQALTDAAAQTKQASQAGEAARHAGQQAAQAARESAGATPESAAAAEASARAQSLSQSAAAPAQQAATNLALAATTAQAAMGLPENALNQQNMGQHGSPKPGDGQPGQDGQTAENNQPSNQPGQEATDTAGLQTTKEYGLPPELAKLGLTPDDWTRLRSLVTSGAEGGGGDQVPAEYRELVRGYFRALATGAATTPSPRK